MRVRRKAPNWDDVRALVNQLQRGKPLKLTDHVLTVLRRSGAEVALTNSEVEAALTSVRRATALFRKIWKRIGQGENRLGDALLCMYRLREAGDLDGARQQMRNVLAVEIVPFYRQIAESQLVQLDDWKPPTRKAPARKAPTRKAPARMTAPARKPPTRKPPTRKAPTRKTAPARTGKP